MTDLVQFIGSSGIKPDRTTIEVAEWRNPYYGQPPLPGDFFEKGLLAVRVADGQGRDMTLGRESGKLLLDYFGVAEPSQLVGRTVDGLYQHGSLAGILRYTNP